jgi:hypothetical protein
MRLHPGADRRCRTGSRERESYFHTIALLGVILHRRVVTGEPFEPSPGWPTVRPDPRLISSSPRRAKRPNAPKQSALTPASGRSRAPERWSVARLVRTTSRRARQDCCSSTEPPLCCDPPRPSSKLPRTSCQLWPRLQARADDSNARPGWDLHTGGSIGEGAGWLGDARADSEWARCAGGGA